MVVFNMRFLRGLHGITVKNVQPLLPINTDLEQIGLFKFAAAIGEQKFEEFRKQSISELTLIVIQSRRHALAGLFKVEASNHELHPREHKCLNVWATLLIVYGIHFNSGNVRILLDELEVVGVFASVVVGGFLAFLVLLWFTLGFSLIYPDFP
jgi:hypothetical protein